MTSVAVVAHVDKQLGGGLGELREMLSRAGVMSPMWFEVTKSKQAPKSVRQAISDGADLVFVWGGDGMVQRSVDALAGTNVPIAIVPAGTANLLAANLGVPKNIEQAVQIGLHGARRLLDLGVINGEHFGVMAGTGFDALMMRDADRAMKDRVGRLAYVWTGLRHLDDAPVWTRIRVDGKHWFSGPATCVLVGNVGTITGGLTVFEEAQPDDGVLDIGVVTARGRLQWSKVMGRMVAGRVSGSPLVRRTTGKKFNVRLEKRLPYELDGGDRDRTDHFKVHVDPQAIAVCVPDRERTLSTASVVPETWQLSGDDAWETLRETGRFRLLRDAFLRMRVADGFSHARSLAFMVSLTMVQGIIAVVGLATVMGNATVTDVIVRTIKGAVPGPAGQALTAAAAQAQHAGASRQYIAVVLGTLGSLISGTTAMGQLERGLNRLYGVEQDRPFVRKYGLALLLAVTVGTLVSVALISIVFGREFGPSVHSRWFDRTWGYTRWPLGLAFMIAAVGLLFRWCPRRRQPAWSWMAFGAFVAVTLWLVVTVALGGVFRLSSSFGETYGPLAGMVALLLWALLTAIVVLYGAAVSAQLEGVRAGRRRPQDTEKVAHSEPAGDGGAPAVRMPVQEMQPTAAR